MLSETIAVVAVCWAVLMTMLWFIMRLERNWWRSEVEDLQDELLRWEKRLAEHEYQPKGDAKYHDCI